MSFSVRGTVHRYPGAFALLFALTIMWPAFMRGLYGLDWTDSTYHYAEALNVFSGGRPHVTFDTHVGGLSFVVESMLFKVFSPTYLTHRSLGLVLHGLIIALIVSTLVRVIQDHVLVLAITVVLPLTYIGEQVYFNFNDLAFIAGLVMVRIAVSDIRRENMDVILGLIAGAAILIKHNIGILLFASLLLTRIVISSHMHVWNTNTVRSLTRIVGCGLLPPLAYAVYLGKAGITRLLVVVASSAELKASGQSALHLLASAIGVPETTPSWMIIPAIMLLAYWYMDTRAASRRWSLLMLGAMMVMPALMQLFQSFRIASLIRIAMWLSIHLLVIYLLFRAVLMACARERKVNPRRFGWRADKPYRDATAALFLTSAMMFAHEMSWPGSGYQNHYLATAAAGLSFAVITKGRGFGSLTRSRRVMAVPGLALAVVAVLSGFAPVREYRNSRASGLTMRALDGHLGRWPVSTNDQTAIATIRAAITSCGATTAFQIPWTPIIYHLFSLDNVTTFDLPYVDTITERDATNIITALSTHLPDIIFVEMEVYMGPFEGRAMKRVMSHIQSSVRQGDYREMTTVHTDAKKWKLYCRIPESSPTSARSIPQKGEVKR